MCNEITKYLQFRNGGLMVPKVPVVSKVSLVSVVCVYGAQGVPGAPRCLQCLWCLSCRWFLWCLLVSVHMVPQVPVVYSCLLVKSCVLKIWVAIAKLTSDLHLTPSKVFICSLLIPG